MTGGGGSALRVVEVESFWENGVTASLSPSLLLSVVGSPYMRRRVLAGRGLVSNGTEG